MPEPVGRVEEDDDVVVVTERRDAASDTELAARLAPLREAMRRHVADGSVAGLVTLVDDGSGHPVIDRYGADGSAGADPMGRRSTVPIGALSTAWTATAVLLLVEDGAVELHDPIDELLPELSGRQVLRTIGSPLHDTVPANRRITLLDLLTSRSGFGVGAASTATTPVHRAVSSLGLDVLAPDARLAPLALDEWLQRLATLPLLHQPGERRLGRTDAMLLGALIERLTGKSLPAVLRERVLDPLHLHDTDFAAPERADCGADTTRRLVDGAAGLHSSVHDVWTFASMLVDAGRTGGGTRLLAPSTVRSMLSDRGGAAADGNDAAMSDERGWGLGISTPPDGAMAVRVSDGFGLDGTGSCWRSSATTGATAVMLTLPGTSRPAAARLAATFWNGVDRASI